MNKAGIVDYEKVHVLDITNGARLETYVIPDKPGSKSICIAPAPGEPLRRRMQPRRDGNAQAPTTKVRSNTGHPAARLQYYRSICGRYLATYRKT